MISLRRRIGRGHLRVGWIVADQGLVSLSSFALAALVARAVSPHAFGDFTLLYSVYLVVVGVSRSFASEPLLIRYPGGDLDTLRDGCRWSTGATVTAGAAVGICGLVTLPLLHDGSLRLATLGLALCVPGLLLKDAWRYCFFALGTPFQAVLNDAIWTGVQLGGVIWLARDGHHEVAGMITVWGASATACAALGMLQARLLPHPQRLVAWLWRHRDLAPRFSLEYLVAGGALQATIWFAGILAGVVTAGALRAGEILLGPPRVLMQAAQPAMVPEGARLLRTTPRHVLPTSLWSSLALTLATLAWSILLLAFSPRLGDELFGATWQYARPVVLPLAVAALTNAASAGAAIGLRIMAAARASLRVRLLVAPITLALAVVGVLVAGAAGAAWGIAAGGALGGAVWWYALARELRARHHDADPPLGQAALGTHG
ncbi:MAG TPA: hypothetical protein VIA06_19445 [Candidatus Dormibacteraeota bacterium]|jgi:O-antigen/teichoic acid export membrane protein|nr:hypothetical protein [Candidatus Dormibacteraeota bacterium]